MLLHGTPRGAHEAKTPVTITTDDGRECVVLVKYSHAVMDVADKLCATLALPAHASKHVRISSGGRLLRGDELLSCVLDSSLRLQACVHASGKANAHLPPSIIRVCAGDEESALTPQMQSRIAQVRAGCFNASNHGPELAMDGEGGTYFLTNAAGRRVACFKPRDEEPFADNNPKKFAGSMGSSGLRRGVKSGEGFEREIAASMLDSTHVCGVPETIRMEALHAAFNNPDGAIIPKVGSFQEYVVADDVIGNLGSRVLARCELREVQKIALLDMRLMNLDRNEANILVKFTGANRNCGRITLVPIDHGYCLPDCLEVSEIDWVWYNYPQVKKPLDPELVKYVSEIDIEEDVKLLRSKLDIREECLWIMRVCTTMLKQGVAEGLSLHDIAGLMIRSDDGAASPLERLVASATRLTDMMLWNVRAANPRKEIGGGGGGGGGGDGSAPIALNVSGFGPLQLLDVAPASSTLVGNARHTTVQARPKNIDGATFGRLTGVVCEAATLVNGAMFDRAMLRLHALCLTGPDGDDIYVGVCAAVRCEGAGAAPVAAGGCGGLRIDRHVTAPECYSGGASGSGGVSDRRVRAVTAAVCAAVAGLVCRGAYTECLAVMVLYAGATAAVVAACATKHEPMDELTSRIAVHHACAAAVELAGVPTAPVGAIEWGDCPRVGVVSSRPPLAGVMEHARAVGDHTGRSFLSSHDMPRRLVLSRGCTEPMDRRLDRNKTVCDLASMGASCASSPSPSPSPSPLPAGGGLRRGAPPAAADGSPRVPDAKKMKPAPPPPLRLDFSGVAAAGAGAAPEPASLHEPREASPACDEGTDPSTMRSTPGGPVAAAAAAAASAGAMPSGDGGGRRGGDPLAPVSMHRVSSYSVDRVASSRGASRASSRVPVAERERILQTYVAEQIALALNSRTARAKAAAAAAAAAARAAPTPAAVSSSSSSSSSGQRARACTADFEELESGADAAHGEGETWDFE